MPPTQQDLDITKTSDEIQGLLRVLKGKDAIIRLLYYHSVHFEQVFTNHGEEELANNFRDLAEACLFSLGGEQLVCSEWKWGFNLDNPMEVAFEFLSAYSRLLVRYGHRDSKPIQWITYILGKINVQRNSSKP